MERTSQRAEANLQNLERFTRPLGDRGEQIVGNVDSSIRKLDELLAQLVNFSDALNTSEGSLGRFVHDPELYDRLDRAAANVEEVSRKLRPIVDDVRVFTDKVSRHPGVILRDAVRPGPGIK
jgi:phospholipid/cholesterol/gamma-HCH transport system substrate-binding protein